MATTKLETQSFVLTLDDDTYAPIRVELANEELSELYEDDAHKVTTALIRELAINLKASEEMNVAYEARIDELTEESDEIFEENQGLRSDNEMLRDELDAS